MPIPPTASLSPQPAIATHPLSLRIALCSLMLGPDMFERLTRGHKTISQVLQVRFGYFPRTHKRTSNSVTRLSSFQACNNQTLKFSVIISPPNSISKLLEKKSYVVTMQGHVETCAEYHDSLRANSGSFSTSFGSVATCSHHR